MLICSHMLTLSDVWPTSPRSARVFRTRLASGRRPSVDRDSRAGKREQLCTIKVEMMTFPPTVLRQRYNKALNQSIRSPFGDAVVETCPILLGFVTVRLDRGDTRLDGCFQLCDLGNFIRPVMSILGLSLC